MAPQKVVHFIVLLALLYTNFCNAQNYIELITTQDPSNDQDLKFDDCLSWRLAVETNNYQDWKAPPKDCRDYVEKYMLGGQYERDCFTVTNISLAYVNSLLPLNEDGKDVWIFDIDETCLNNTPFYDRDDVKFGEPPKGSFFKWVKEGNVAPANSACLSLYRELRKLHVKIVFLTGMGEEYKKTRIDNMKQVGFKPESEDSKDSEDLVFFRKCKEERTASFKSRIRTELVEKDQYRIIGNMGDQWKDFSGNHPGNRTFKMPNPMYRF